ncbi:MAG: hypothetical protein ACK44Z_13125, partial [Pirellulaceae bacterium]
CGSHHRQMVDGYRQRFFLALHRVAAVATERRRLPRGRAFPNQSLPSLAVATIARWWMVIDSGFF